MARTTRPTRTSVRCASTHAYMARTSRWPSWASVALMGGLEVREVSLLPVRSLFSIVLVSHFVLRGGISVVQLFLLVFRFVFVFLFVCFFSCVEMVSLNGVKHSMIK